MLVNKVKNLYRVLLPIKFRSLVRKILKVFLYNYRYIRLKSSLFFLKEVQLILGAALTSEKNWFSTNEEWFDISNSNDWKNLFRNKKKLKRAQVVPLIRE